MVEADDRSPGGDKTRWTSVTPGVTVCRTIHQAGTASCLRLLNEQEMNFCFDWVLMHIWIYWFLQFNSQLKYNFKTWSDFKLCGRSGEHVSCQHGPLLWLWVQMRHLVTDELCPWESSSSAPWCSFNDELTGYWILQYACWCSNSSFLAG